SFNEDFTDCRVKSSNCERSYFDYIVASTGSIALDFFLMNLDGSQRRFSKRIILPSIVTPRSTRSADGDIAPSDWRNEVDGGDRPVRRVTAEPPRRTNASDELATTNTLAFYAWDWLKTLEGVQRSDLVADRSEPDNAAGPTDPPRAIEVPRLNRPNDGNDDAAPDKGETREAPAKPDVRKDLEGDLTPEPSTLLLIASALPFAAAVVRARRRRE
ncbi:MAG: PEP-CTERM sorting domain-containing protein, partial [Gemmatimonadaceae bacterium]